MFFIINYSVSQDVFGSLLINVLARIFHENAPASAFPVATRLERLDLSSSTGLVGAKRRSRFSGAAGSFNCLLRPRNWEPACRRYRLRCGPERSEHELHGRACPPSRALRRGGRAARSTKADCGFEIEQDQLKQSRRWKLKLYSCFTTSCDRAKTARVWSMIFGLRRNW